MDILREKIGRFDPVIVRQQCGMTKYRYKQFMSGELDNQLLGWHIARLKYFIWFNRGLIKKMKFPNQFRLIGKPKLHQEAVAINNTQTK